MCTAPEHTSSSTEHTGSGAEHTRYDPEHRSSGVAHYDGADGGKTAYYILRWENTRGECGPWSPSVAATIPA